MENDPIVAEKMNSLPKFVFSRMLDRANWNNTRLVKANIAEEIMKLKQQTGGDLYVFGSADLSAALIRENLIDEYRLMVNPVALGRGKPLFKDIQAPLLLDFQKARPFRNGNVLLYYRQAIP
jgi:dihydrofolate reductase